MSSSTFDTRQCALGEGPLWHPLRQQLFWFDILGKRMLSRAGDRQQIWQFDEYVSAAGWVDQDRVLIASQSALLLFDITTGAQKTVVALEADNQITRSNDGRGDPWGGFWIGTMGKAAEPSAGAIYRYYQGRLKKMFSRITIPNAICFAPDRSCAYFTDTPSRQIKRVALDSEGWPDAPAEVLLDLSGEGLNPDGAVTDKAGNLWIALWGAGRLICASSTGKIVTTTTLPASQPSCPAFGGTDFKTLFVTSAADGLETAKPKDGTVFYVENAGNGLPEPRLIL